MFGGPPDDILTRARQGKITIAISDAILDEVTRVLQEKFRFSDEAAAITREEIRGFTDHVSPTQEVTVITEDPTDNRILECAQAAKSEYLVTRDKHLLKLDRFGPTKILLAAEFLETIRARGQAS